MSKVKILVVEDEVIIADNLCDILQELGYQALEPAISYTEALRTIENDSPDVAILDIQLSGKKSGIDIANRIIEDYKFPFIFLTSNSDPATIQEAKKVMPSAYLVKPFTKEALNASIEVALYNFSKKSSFFEEKKIIDKDNLIVKEALFFKEKGVFYKLVFDDILYLKSDHVYLEIVLKDKKKHLIRSSLNNMINKLNSSFIRVHRGFIINTKYLKEINRTYLKVDNSIVPIGKKYHDNILKSINII